MVDLVTYDYLLAEVPDQLSSVNQELVDDMPNVIRRAQERLFYLLERDLFQVKLSTVFTVTNSNPFVDLNGESPQVYNSRSFNRVIDSATNRSVPMEKRDRDYLNMMYGTTVSGVPIYYAEEEDTLKHRVYPTPNQSYDIIVFANQQPVYLDTGQQTSVLTERFPRVIEQMCLFEGAKFMKHQGDKATYGDSSNKAVVEANAQISRRRRDQVSEREHETANVQGN